MADQGFKRKLSAILSADVKGYSRLMGDNEEATVRTIKSYRAVFNDLAQQYRGRIVDSPGDNILAEFNSVVDAVNCAVEIQRELAERNAELAESRKMVFRIGVNLGDVIEEDGRIYGDGVNIAARVESLAEPGGICISGRAYDQVENKLGLKLRRPWRASGQKYCPTYKGIQGAVLSGGRCPQGGSSQRNLGAKMAQNSHTSRSGRPTICCTGHLAVLYAPRSCAACVR